MVHPKHTTRNHRRNRNQTGNRTPQKPDHRNRNAITAAGITGNSTTFYRQVLESQKDHYCNKSDKEWSRPEARATAADRNQNAATGNRMPNRKITARPEADRKYSRLLPSERFNRIPQQSHTDTLK